MKLKKKKNGEPDFDKSTYYYNILVQYESLPEAKNTTKLQKYDMNFNFWHHTAKTFFLNF